MLVHYTFIEHADNPVYYKQESILLHSLTDRTQKEKL